MVIDHEEEAPSEKRPRGRINSKLDVKRYAQTITLQDILKGFIVAKEVSTEKQ